MQLTRAADYGVRLMLCAAAGGPEPVLTVADLARREGLPAPFLGKVAQRLRTAGLLQSSRGHAGGFRLGRPARETSLRDVVEAIEGPIHLNWCLVRPGACGLEATCPAHAVWCRAQTDLLHRLEGACLADMVRLRPDAQPPECPGGGAVPESGA